MAERSIHRVQIALVQETVSIPWESRQVLLAELRRREMREVVDAIEAVGTSRSVTLTPEQKGELREAIRVWAERDEHGFAVYPRESRGFAWRSRASRTTPGPCQSLSRSAHRRASGPSLPGRS